MDYWSTGHIFSPLSAFSLLCSAKSMKSTILYTIPHGEFFKTIVSFGTFSAVAIVIVRLNVG